MDHVLEECAGGTEKTTVSGVWALWQVGQVVPTIGVGGSPVGVDAGQV